MKEIKTDSRLLKIITYAGVVLMVCAGIWYLYRALKMIL